ncbi:MAG: glycosyltransferase [Gracilibacteraceae bacterium]|jgi:glycosyltransferase involved in cell wall biosynthesis|nr:glycosyltransferase [Gracilibacteraceae bacterium]
MPDVSVSVIMPVHNAGVFLDRAVRSVLDQTLDDLELILIDDGSTDVSPARCDFWAANDKRVRVLHREHGGPGRARNAGIAAAGGKYIGFADSDDYALPELYRVLLSAAAGENLPAVKCGAFILPEASFVSPGPGSEEETLRRWPKRLSGQYRYAAQDIAGPEILHYLSNNLLDNSLWTLLLREDICRAIPFTAHDRMEDCYYFMDLARDLDVLRLLPERLYIYLTRAGSVSQSAGSALLLERGAHDMELFDRAAAARQTSAMTNAFNRLARTLTQYGDSGHQPATPEELRLYMDLIAFFRRHMNFFRPAHRAHQAEDPFNIDFFSLRQENGTDTVLDFAAVESLNLLQNPGT